MGRTSKDLLHLEHRNSSSSPIERTLLVRKNDSVGTKPHPDEKPITTVPKSQVLGKVKDFLGIISEANERLCCDAKDNSENFDMEVLNGNESEVIEMDLMLGIADLHTPEAVAAAESAIAGYQPVLSLAGSSSGSQSEESSDDDETDSDDENGDENNCNYDYDEKRSIVNLKRSKDGNKDSSGKNVEGNPSKKRAKIIEL